MTNHDFDVLVIGAGPAGENAADLAARGGLRVGLVEHELVGGECSYWACMPSKGLLRPGEALEMIGRVPGARQAVTGALDVEEALRRRDTLAARWDDSSQVNWVKDHGIELIRGHGRLAGERRVEVETPDGLLESYQVRKAVVLATGSAASFPPIEGLEEARVWDSRMVTSAKEVPGRLLVIGGGVVEVTIVELFHHLISQEEPFAGVELQGALERMGIVVHTLANTRCLERAGSDGPVTAQVELAGGASIAIEADEVLVATGRRPNTIGLGVETVGLRPGAPVEVDDHLQAVGVPGGWLYAVGDVNGRSLLTHTGKYQARIAGAHIAGVDTTAWGDVVAMPRVAFTSPEVAAVGLTESQAVAKGIEVRTVTYDIGRVSGASTLGRGYHGTCKLVVDPGREVIVGATFVGPRVGELINAATFAIVGEIPLGRLWHAIPAFPTLSEVWLRLLEEYRDRYGAVFT
jgi:dihydrolipoamide dehydrogenase